MTQLTCFLSAWYDRQLSVTVLYLGEEHRSGDKSRQAALLAAWKGRVVSEAIEAVGEGVELHLAGGEVVANSN